MEKRKFLYLMALNLSLMLSFMPFTRAVMVYDQPDEVNDLYLFDKTTITKVYSDHTGNDCIDLVNVRCEVINNNLTKVTIKVDSFITGEYCPNWDFIFYFVINLDSVIPVTKTQNPLAFGDHIAKVYYDEVNGEIKGKYPSSIAEGWGIPFSEFNVTLNNLNGEGRSTLSFNVYQEIEEEDFGVLSYQKIDDNIETYALDGSPNVLIDIEEEDSWQPLMMGETFVFLLIIVFLIAISLVMLYRSLKSSKVIGKPQSSSKRK